MRGDKKNPDIIEVNLSEMINSQKRQNCTGERGGKGREAARRLKRLEKKGESEFVFSSTDRNGPFSSPIQSSQTFLRHQYICG